MSKTQNRDDSTRKNVPFVPRSLERSREQKSPQIFFV